MQILVDGNEKVLMSIHYEKGMVPDIKVVNLTADRTCVKEIIIGNVVIQVFEREE